MPSHRLISSGYVKCGDCKMDHARIIERGWHSPVSLVTTVAPVGIVLPSYLPMGALNGLNKNGVCNAMEVRLSLKWRKFTSEAFNQAENATRVARSHSDWDLIECWRVLLRVDIISKNSTTVENKIFRLSGWNACGYNRRVQDYTETAHAWPKTEVLVLEVCELVTRIIWGNLT